MEHKLIVIEGIDGSGKSTITRKLSEYFKDSCAVFVEPTTNSPYTETIRAILSGKGRNNGEGDPGGAKDDTKDNTKGEGDLLELFKQDRLWNIQNNLLPSMAKNKLTILDRYYFSTAAYQGKDFEEVSGIIDDYLSNEECPQPDAVFYLRIDADTALSRIALRKGSLEIFEKKTRLEKILRNYDYVFTKGALPFGVFILDAKSQPDDLVHFIVTKVFPVQ